MISVNLFDEFAPQHIIALLCIDIVLDLLNINAISVK